MTSVPWKAQRHVSPFRVIAASRKTCTACGINEIGAVYGNDAPISTHALGELELQIQRVGISLPILRGQIPPRRRLEVLDGVDSFFISVHINTRLFYRRDGAAPRLHGLREMRDISGRFLGVRRVVFRLVASSGLRVGPRRPG